MLNPKQGYEVKKEDLPNLYPTHMHSAEFWEALGRTIGTFSLLEEVLGKAVFAFQATKPYDEAVFEDQFNQWQKELGICLNGQLGGLIRIYEKAVKAHPETTLENLSDLITDLYKISRYRNTLCHGSWRTPPNSNGETIPFFFDRKMERFEKPINASFLYNIQSDTVHIICAVINTVTRMGWQFPGSDGPGEVIINN